MEVFELLLAVAEVAGALVVAWAADCGPAVSVGDALAGCILLNMEPLCLGST